MQVLLFLILLNLPFRDGVEQGIWTEFYLGSFHETLKSADLCRPGLRVSPTSLGTLAIPQSFCT